LAAAALSLAVQFVAVITMMLPPLAETFSACPVAQHFNRQASLPPRLLIVEGRIGSLVFYLSPQLRAGLTPENLQQLPANDLPPLCPGDVIAVPERKIVNLQRYLRLGAMSYEVVGCYRLYLVPKPHAAAGPGNGATTSRNMAASL
jgi:hypothetical protein